MKKLSVLLSIFLCLCLFAGCAGTPVIYHSDCDCSTDGTADSGSSNTAPLAEGELKTGLAIVTAVGESKDASAESDGEGKYDVTVVAVLVDGDGIIRDCIIDGIATSVKFDTAGKITADLTVNPQTKNELGESYGMVAWGGAKAEWNVQAAALAKFAVGKTVAQLKDGAIDETGKAPADSDLASQATIYLGGYVSAIETAVAKAQSLGAKTGDTLKIATVASVSGSKSADGDSDGTAQLDATSTALTLKDGVITSAAIDSVQAKVSFSSSGKITSDLKATVKTKNELGSDYGMVAWGGAIAEWDAQAASFAKYITGKTPDEVKGIAVNDKNAPADADLSTSVTIAIGDFMSLVEKASK